MSFVFKNQITPDQQNAILSELFLIGACFPLNIVVFVKNSIYKKSPIFHISSVHKYVIALGKGSYAIVVLVSVLKNYYNNEAFNIFFDFSDSFTKGSFLQ